jgi:hypothetical protein
MSRNTLLARLTPLIRDLTDLGLKLSGHLIAYDNVTVYRYSVKETQYKDKEKTLLETIRNVSMYLNFPGEVPNLTTMQASAPVTNSLFIEDLLPIIAIFPWKVRGQRLKVEANDEFVVIFTDEFGIDHNLRFEITEMRSDWVEQHLYKEFVVVPKRTDVIDTTVNPDGSSTDSNIDVGKVTTQKYSEYDT